MVGGSVSSVDDRVRFYADGDHVNVTVRSAQPQAAVTRRYDVADLPFMLGYDDGTRSAAARHWRAVMIARIERELVGRVDPRSWRWNGGTIGCIGVDPDGRVLTVTQTPDNQEDVARRILAFRGIDVPSRPTVAW